MRGVERGRLLHIIYAAEAFANSCKLASGTCLWVKKSTICVTLSFTSCVCQEEEKNAWSRTRDAVLTAIFGRHAMEQAVNESGLTLIGR